LLVFLVSMGFTFVSFALGIGSLPHLSDGHLHAGPAHHVDFHFGHGGGHGVPHNVHVDAGHGDGLNDSLSPFNMATILAFVTWFSGTGYLLTQFFGLGGLLATAIAGAVGLVGAGIVFFVLARLLLPGQSPYLRSEDFEMEGTVGRIAAAIRPGATGELIYTRRGARHVASARSVNGEAIERGAEVVVVRHERGIAYVQPFSEFVETSAGAVARDA
jgi:hypothetical protein